MLSRSCDWQVHMSLINKNGETRSHLLNAFGFVGNIFQNMESSQGRPRELRTIMMGNAGPGAGEGPAPGLRPILQPHSPWVLPPILFPPDSLIGGGVKIPEDNPCKEVNFTSSCKFNMC